MTDSTAVRTRGVSSRRFPDSIENRASWIAALLAIAILTISYGAPLIVVVALKPIAAALDTDRSVVALAAALVWVGTGAGGIVMGWVADRIGLRQTVIFGALMTALGLAVSAVGRIWTLYLGHALLIGFLGGGALYPPLLIYISRWFDRRRGAALALISSGQYIAGVIWPSAFQHALAGLAWQGTMLAFAGALMLIVPLALLLKPAPQPGRATRSAGFAYHGTAALRLRPNTVQALLCGAGFLCCVPMAMPSSHLVAFCSDLGIAPAQGAAMLSVLLGCAFASRMFWGWAADRVGGLATVFAGSACQALAVALFSITRSEAGLFAVSAAYGLGFSGIIPAYVVAIRELFPSAQASWRVPTLLFTSMGGMAFGSWFAGALYDYFGFYAPAFVAGALFNLANLAVVGFLLMRQQETGRGRTLEPAREAGLD
ncbi:MAG: MFS transporter [Alphaproteobacteria bacterium]|nr:MFS transporter [Alphaproteobacteria bacterium]